MYFPVGRVPHVPRGSKSKFDTNVCAGFIVPGSPFIGDSIRFFMNLHNALSDNSNLPIALDKSRSGLKTRISLPSPLFSAIVRASISCAKKAAPWCNGAAVRQ